MAQRSAGAERSREPASEPGARRERSPAPTGEVPRIFQLGTALGNRTTTALLAGGLLQRKVAVGPANDPLEREADRVAERVLSQSESAAESVSSSGAAVQRQCAACAAGGKPCAECEKEDEKLQRQEAEQPAGGPAPAQLDSHLATLGPGRPLSNDLRSYFEPRFDHDFGDVRLHTGSAADAAARTANARAFTLRQDVVFAAGQYAPATRGGRRLLAHELAHVVQQAPPAVRRQATTDEAPTSETSMPPAAEAETTAEPSAEPTPQESKTEAVEPRSGEAPKGLIVPDEAEPGPGRMTRTAFLDELHTAACTAAEEGLAGTDRSAKGCPWIHHYFRLYRGMSAERIEADLLRYVPATRAATTARDYIAPAADHIRGSVRHWAETGELTGVPQGLPGMSLLGAMGGSLAGLGRMLFKARPGGAQGAAQPAAVAARLGEGSPLSGSVRSRMERGLGTGLGGVRLHTDATAARLAGHHNAHAFTVGRHVAFGAGEYRPGTLAGDALLAHELAHTVQQRAAPSHDAGSHSEEALEQEADRSAVGAAARLWSRTHSGLARWGRRSAAYLQSGFRLQRCTEDVSPAERAESLTDEEMGALGLEERVELLSLVANEWVVGNPEEQTLIRLLGTTPTADASGLIERLKSDNADLLRRLESAIDFSDYRQYHETLRLLFFRSMDPQQAAEALAGAQEFPWADPGLIEAYWRVRFYYEEVSLTDQGKLHVVYWTNIGPMGIKTADVELDPFETIAVRFHHDEEHMAAAEGDVVFMPAVTLLSLYSKQFKKELSTAADVTLLFAGGAGLVTAGARATRIIAAIELTVGAIDLAIKEFRSQIAQTPEGREFLRWWDTVSLLIQLYSLARVAAEVPSVFAKLRSSFQRFKSAGGSGVSQDTLANLEGQVDELADQTKKAQSTLSESADEAVESAGTGKTASGASETTPTTTDATPGTVPENPSSSSPVRTENEPSGHVGETGRRPGDGPEAKPAGEGPFPNQLKDRLDDELKLADRLGVKPSTVGTAAFDKAINSGTVKWAVTEDGQLLVIPKFVKGQEIPHTALTRGGPVKTAGEAEIAGSKGSYFMLEINNHSGHYIPSTESLEIGKKAFRDLGVKFPD